MKNIAMFSMICFLTMSARADVIFDFYGARDSPSELGLYLDNETGPLDYTVAEIKATISTDDGVMNRTNDGFGINGSRSGDTTTALDGSDALDIHFDKQITITELDFRNFGEDEIIAVIIGSTTNSLSYNHLDSTTFAHAQNLNWNVYANQNVRFIVTSTGNGIALDAIIVQTIPEPATVSLLIISGIATLALRRFFC